MATYTFGSERRAHDRRWLACPTLRWLGIHAADISHFRVPTSQKIHMTERDRSRVRKMLERESFSAKPGRTFWRQQLQEFLDLNWYLDVAFPLHDALLLCLILQVFNCTFVPHPMTIRIPYSAPANAKLKQSQTRRDCFQANISSTKLIVKNSGRIRMVEARKASRFPTPPVSRLKAITRGSSYRTVVHVALVT